MNKLIKTGCFVSLFLMVGCAHIPFLGKPSQPATPAKALGELEQPLEQGGFVEKGRIVNAQGLRQGKNVVVIPFKAGVNVSASDELDRIALMIVKGVAETFANDDKKQFNVLTAEDSEKADFIIQGHVTSVKTPSKARRWILLKGQKALSIEGKMVDPRNEELIAVFTDTLETKDEDYMTLGHRIGKNIGLFILSGAE